MMRSHW